RFPKRVKYRGRVLATIYGKSKSYPLYRVAWTASGRRTMQAFRTYSEAKRHADAKKTELAQGSAAAALTGRQARDALAAFERLRADQGVSGRLYRVAWPTKVQVPQSPCRDFGQEPQLSPCRNPPVPAMGGPQGLPASGAPPERSRRHAAGTGKRRRDSFLHAK